MQNVERTKKQCNPSFVQKTVRDTANNVNVKSLDSDDARVPNWKALASASFALRKRNKLREESAVHTERQRSFSMKRKKRTKRIRIKRCLISERGYPTRNYRRCIFPLLREISLWKHDVARC